MTVRHALLLGAGSALLTACGAVGLDGTAAVDSRPPAVAAPSVPVTTPVTTPAPAPPPVPSSPVPQDSSTPLPATLQSAFEEVKSGVVRLEVAACTGGGMGTGFQLGPDLVATVAHVVEDGHVVRVIQGTTSTAGTVIGIDPGTDVALVRTSTPLTGYVFSFSPTSPSVGDQVAAIGFPLRAPISFHTGTVNGLDRKAVIEGIPRHGLVEIDAATKPGNSGGPVIRADGGVVGLVDAGPEGEPGRRMAVSSATASALIDEWRQRAQPVIPSDCSAAVDRDGGPLPVDEYPTDPREQARTTLAIYFDAVNHGDFATAAAQLATPPSLPTFSEGVASSQDVNIRVRSVQLLDDRIVVWVTFTSTQDAGRGPAERPEETCTDWSLDYSMVQKNGLWLIDRTDPHEGPRSAPCAGPAGAGVTPND